MPSTLLPASAAAFAPRAAPTIALGSKVETWLTQALKRINRVKRPLNSIPQHYRCLSETLSGPAAIWSLASIMLPSGPDAELCKDSNMLAEALLNHKIIHIEAYIVHVDMVSQHEVAFKLTKESIDALVEYHKDIYSVDAVANLWDWSDKEEHVKKLHEEFRQAVNKYVFRTHVRALEGLEDDGAGELLEGRSQDVKNGVMALFLPLLPPPPPMDVLAAPTISIPYAAGGQWWPQIPISSSPPLSAPMESWVLGSSLSPTTTCVDSLSSWSSSGLIESHLSSPTPSYSTPPYEQPFHTAAPYFNPLLAMAELGTLPLPSVIAQQCGSVAGGGYGSLPWSYNDLLPQHNSIHI